MKILSIIVFLFLGCSSPGTINEKPCNVNLAIHNLYPQYNIKIGFPVSWSKVDSTVYGMHKHLVRTQTIHNEDSTGYVFFHVLDFKNDLERKIDMISIKSWGRSIAPDQDSIIDVKVEQINGWITMFQKTINRNNKAKQSGQIICAVNNREVKLIFGTVSKDSAESALIIDCIMKSFVIIK